MTVVRMRQRGRSAGPGYRFDPERKRPDDDLNLRNEIQRTLWSSPVTAACGLRRTEAARMEGESQAGGPHPAHGQLTLLTLPPP
jgi:hypothetical protein